ncbi:hypothetical protein FVE85_5809 [Porphyridium purpureum]|uniref:Uncharacterized protein n=1 Tax=Porphyridium purpureum TaxID=35688 RepID=A0A5J4Z5F8_PORPP|nr:hypothetical protein FVE85_5809 [Porphyridium purpureum]|eukprot:POR2695..scf295_1
MKPRPFLAWLHSQLTSKSSAPRATVIAAAVCVSLVVLSFLGVAFSVVLGAEKRDSKVSPELQPTKAARMLGVLEVSDHDFRDSTQYSPLVVSECVVHMPQHYAPCLASSMPFAVEFGEELMYPSFRIAVPNFADDHSRMRFFDRMRSENLVETASEPSVLRGVLNDHSVTVGERHARNFILRDVVVSAQGAQALRQQVCSAERIDLDVWPTYKNISESTMEISRAIIAADQVPLSLYNLLDQSTRVLEQVWHLISPSTHILVPSLIEKGSEADQLFQLLGIVAKPLSQDETARFHELLISCQESLIHPFLLIRLSERLGIWTKDQTPPQPKVVLYIDATSPDPGFAGSERVLIDVLAATLKGRGENERLVRWSDLTRKMTSLEDRIAFLRDQVSIIVGPSGDDMRFHRFARRSTLVIELMSEARISLRTWEEARILEQNFWLFALRTDANGRILLPETTLQSLSKIITEHLFQRSVAPSGASKFYDWHF